MRQTGKVIETKGKKAVVRFVRSDACGHCNACFRLGSNEADIDIDNALNAQIGDLVGIEMHAKSVLKASSLQGDLYAALGGVLFAAGAFFILRALEPKFSRMTEFKPRMVEIIEQTEEPERANEGGENNGE